MNKSNYDNDNCVKASFDAAYTALTPHQYLHDMTAVNYRMADYMHPFLAAAVDAEKLGEVGRGGRPQPFGRTFRDGAQHADHQTRRDDVRLGRVDRPPTEQT